jgi:hypothetical protein
MTKVIVAVRNFVNAPENEPEYRLCQPGFEQGTCQMHVRSVRQIARSFIREGLSLIVVLILAENSGMTWFSSVCRYPRPSNLA